MDTRYQEMDNQKMVIDGHQMMGFNYENGDIYKPESFVVDLESVSPSSDVDNNGLTSFFYTASSNSRITLQRSLSKKVPQQGGTPRKFSDRDDLAPSSSPKATQATSSSEKSLSPTTMSVGSQDNFVNNQFPQHQITIKTGNMNAVPEGRLGRRSSFKRSPPSWFYDPKRILFFFATLSSMGTMLLILLTLFVSKRNEKGGVWGWQ